MQAMHRACLWFGFRRSSRAIHVRSDCGIPLGVDQNSWTAISRQTVEIGRSERHRMPRLLQFGLAFGSISGFDMTGLHGEAWQHPLRLCPLIAACATAVRLPFGSCCASSLQARPLTGSAKTTASQAAFEDRKLVTPRASKVRSALGPEAAIRALVLAQWYNPSDRGLGRCADAG